MLPEDGSGGELFKDEAQGVLDDGAGDKADLLTASS
jgi:hypothetical protein